MKNSKDVSIQVTAVSALLGLMLPLSPAHAQNAPADVINTARESCIRDAGAEGFQLKDVVEAGPSDRPDKDAKIVLNLTRNGQLFKQTCYYSKESGAALGDDPKTGTMSAPTADVPDAPNWSNLGWLLVPLVGLGLWWWARNRNAGTTRTGTTGDYSRTGTTGDYGRTGTTGDYGGYAERREVIVRSNAHQIDIRSGPADSYKVTGSLNDGERVTLSGRYNNNWAELVDGGWIPAQYVETR